MPELRWLVLLLLGFAFPSLAQETTPSPAASPQSTSPAGTPGVTLIPRTHEEREDRYRAQHRILLNVQVTDGSGKPVTGLNEEDFTLLDNGEPQKVASFRVVKGSVGFAPVRIVLMLDAVNNSIRDINRDSRSIEHFLKQGQGLLTYPTSIAILTSAGTRIGQPSKDRDAVDGELRMLSKSVHEFDCADENQTEHVVSLGGISTIGLDGIHPDPKGDCLNQRFRHSVSALKSYATEQTSVPGRVILIWIGPGWPLLLSRGFRADTAALKQNFFDNYVELSTSLREAQITLDAVFSPDLFRTVQARSDHDDAFFNGVPSKEQVTASSMGLQVLAHQSGGQILVVGKNLEGEIAQCIADADSYYVLSFDSPPAAALGEFHSLQVKVNRPGLTVRTNTAYYGQP